MRLIDADAVRDALYDADAITMKGVAIINQFPTIEAEPVVHGRWIELPSMAPEYACSECGQSYEWWEVNEAHFCPNCGAKMDGRSEGE